MAITPKPKRTTEAPQTDIDAVIAKGGSIATNEVTNDKEEKAVGIFSLRVPTDLLQDLDNHRKSRRVKVSRQQWILEAIEQRLEREGNASLSG